MKKLIGILAIAATGILGCSGHSMRFLEEDYRGVKVSDKSLAIVLHEGGLALLNKSDIGDDLGKGKPADVFLDFFRSNFILSLQHQTSFDAIRFDQAVSGSAFPVRSFDLDNGWLMKIHLPADKQSCALNLGKTDYILFIESLDVDRLSGAGGEITGGGEMYGGRDQALQHKAIYAIWDNQKGRVVSYGRVDAQVHVFAFVTKNTWYEASEKLARQIFSGTPFEKRTY